jgi:hypothetical protein
MDHDLGELPAPVEVARSHKPHEERITLAYTAEQMRAERDRCYAIGRAETKEPGVWLGDYFTHVRTGVRFVCVETTKHQTDGRPFASLRVVIEPL